MGDPGRSPRNRRPITSSSRTRARELPRTRADPAARRLSDTRTDRRQLCRSRRARCRCGSTRTTISRRGDRRRAARPGRTRQRERVRRRDDQRSTTAGSRGTSPIRAQAAGFCSRPCLRLGSPRPLLLPSGRPPSWPRRSRWLAPLPTMRWTSVSHRAAPRRLRCDARADGRPDRALHRVARARGHAARRRSRRLAGDLAIRACASHPVPVVSAAMGKTAVRRAAAAGAGLLFDSLSTPERIRGLVDTYRASGGTGACILIRRAWIGPPPRDLVDRQLDVYRSYAANRRACAVEPRRDAVERRGAGCRRDRRCGGGQASARSTSVPRSRVSLPSKWWARWAWATRYFRDCVSRA